MADYCPADFKTLLESSETLENLHGALDADWSQLGAGLPGVFVPEPHVPFGISSSLEQHNYPHSLSGRAIVPCETEAAIYPHTQDGKPRQLLPRPPYLKYAAEYENGLQPQLQAAQPTQPVLCELSVSGLSFNDIGYDPQQDGFSAENQFQLPSDLGLSLWETQTENAESVLTSSRPQTHALVETIPKEIKRAKTKEARARTLKIGACIRCGRGKFTCSEGNSCERCAKEGVTCYRVKGSLKGLVQPENVTWLLDLLSACEDLENAETVIPLADVMCLVIRLEGSTPLQIHRVVMGSKTHLAIRDLDSGLCIPQMDGWVDSVVHHAFRFSSTAIATTGKKRYVSARLSETEAAKKEPIFQLAKRCAGYFCFIRELPRANFQGHGKSTYDGQLSKRVSVSLSIFLVKRLSCLMEEVMDDIYHILFPTPRNNQRQDYALLALCVVARVLEELKSLSLCGMVPTIFTNAAAQLTQMAVRGHDSIQRLGKAAMSAGLAIWPGQTFIHLTRHVVKDLPVLSLVAGYELMNMDIKNFGDPDLPGLDYDLNIITYMRITSDPVEKSPLYAAFEDLERAGSLKEFDQWNESRYRHIHLEYKTATHPEEASKPLEGAQNQICVPLTKSGMQVYGEVYHLNYDSRRKSPTSTQGATKDSVSGRACSIADGSKSSLGFLDEYDFDMRESDPYSPPLCLFKKALLDDTQALAKEYFDRQRMLDSQDENGSEERESHRYPWYLSKNDMFDHVQVRGKQYHESTMDTSSIRSTGSSSLLQSTVATGASLLHSFHSCIKRPFSGFGDMVSFGSRLKKLKSNDEADKLAGPAPPAMLQGPCKQSGS